MEHTIQPGLDERLTHFLGVGEEVQVAVRGNVVLNDPEAEYAGVAGEYLLGVTDARLVCVEVGGGENGCRLDASIPVAYLSGVRHEAYDAVDELVVTLTTGSAVRFQVPIGQEHSAGRFAEYVERLAPTQVIPAVPEAGAGQEDGPPDPPALPTADDAYFLRLGADHEVPEGACPHCEVANHPDAVFCHDCGTVL